MADYDVIIVGGGPAGSTAGYLLSNFGLRVLIIDKSSFPRQKLCAGCITYKTVKLLERVYGESVSSLKNRDILNFESSQYEILYRDKLLFRETFNIPFYFIDRYSYDEVLLRKAQETGVEVIKGERVTSYELLRNELRTSAGKVLKTKFVIGADGVSSMIRRSFSGVLFNEKSWQENLATAMEVFVSRSQVKKGIDHPLILLGFINHGYSWIFPNKERLIVGLCGLNIANRRMFLNSFQSLLSSIGIKELHNIKLAGHPLPYGNFLLRPAFGHILLIGDAAGFADPLLGEGIFYAQRSAELASHAIHRTLHKGEDTETVYLQLLRKHLYPDLIYAKRIRYVLFNYLSKFRYLPLKILLKIFGNMPAEAVHGIRTYRWLKRKNAG